MTSNFQLNSTDLDNLYIGATDSAYFLLDAQSVNNRKTVIFGQNFINNTYPAGNFGDRFQPKFSVVPKIDYDTTQVIGVTPTAVYFSDTTKSQTYIRGQFNLLENTPQTPIWTTTGLAVRVSPVQVGVLSNWGQIAAGNYHTAVIKTDKSLWTGGYNFVSRLGLNDSVNRSSLVQVGGSTYNWSSVVCGYAHTAAIKTDGTLWTCGYNSVYGNLGLSDLTNRSSPVQVGTLSNWSQIFSGNNFTVGIKTDGTLWSWGANSYGQLGLSDWTHRSSPVQVGTLTNWSKIDCGDTHTLAIKTDGTLWAWGYNFNGQLGFSDTTNRYSPIQVGALTNWSKVSGGYLYSAAIKTDGTLWSWGYNIQGQLGLSDQTIRSSPVQVGALTNWSQVYCSPYLHTLAIKTDSTLWSWGINSYGQLGLSDQTDRSSPVQVGTASNWSQIASGFYHSIAAKNDGTLWSWGINSYGQLGLYEPGLLQYKQPTGF